MNRKGRKILARLLSPAKNLQGEGFPFLEFASISKKLLRRSVSLNNGNRERKSSSTWALIPDSTSKDHKLEQVECLESWRIMYVELIRPCRDAGKQGAWHGNAAQV